ncbi:hypothetical protein IDJ77_16420 [Mucilaginibacter sp. ZT4R22]|uniref:Uncharacterized protein n=1 Tax=Mucilaginibacter pankratovii TaxID=2772110 RepID=A0ABR7WSY0_9SPHI|nr:hypothetical protein [Mucilaginibacter pankratovii]MBD1365400.1 hypothetical protein [Mucilaginibacter pankratovii]
MKKISLTLILISFFSMLAAAQTEKEDMAIATSIFGKTKKAIITQYMQIADKDSKAFWDMYDQYEYKDNAINQEGLALIKQYTDNYNTLNDSLATKIAGEYLNNTTKYNALYKVYFKRFKKLVGGVKAATLFQIEIYIQTAIQANLQSQIPVIGELQRLQH